MDYVNAESLAKAREMEARFATLAPAAGVLFVTVDPTPADLGQASEFTVRLGMTRTLSEGAGRALIRQVLKKEIDSGLKILAGVYVGRPGACREDSP